MPFIIMFRQFFWPDNALTLSGNQARQCVLFIFFFFLSVCVVTLETIICISEAMGSYEGGKATGVSSKTSPNPYALRHSVNYLALGSRLISLDIL